MNTELHHQYPLTETAAPADYHQNEFEEQFVDDRAGLSPTEVVQLKLLGLLPNRAVPVSCLHIRRDTRR